MGLQRHFNLTEYPPNTGYGATPLGDGLESPLLADS